MNASHQKIIRIAPTGDKKILSKAQKQFNTLTKKIEAEKKRLLEWQEAIPHYNHKVSGEYGRLVEDYNAERVKMVKLLDRAYENKLFKKTDKAKLRHLIIDITAELIAEHGLVELKDLHDRYSEVDFDSFQQEGEALAGDFLKSMMENMYGIEIDADIDLTSPEQMADLLHEKLQERKDKEDELQRKAEERRSKRPKSAAIVRRRGRTFLLRPAFSDFAGLFAIFMSRQDISGICFFLGY